MPGRSAAFSWLRRRSEDVAAGFLAVMFLSFLLQIFARYVINYPLAWTVEASLTAWLWLVFWGAAFVLEDRDHVKFDMIYLATSIPVRRILALVTALAIVLGFLAALPATWDYITFYKIKKSATLRIRLDIVFSVYGVFAIAIVTRYALRAWQLLRGGEPDASSNPHDQVTLE
ncbi:TRAP transporter small permease [Devosia sp.]|uniref:TRAP transporter small permease n=1 Tax=Devosia sp. TaxID=1871048 RepID=UPI0035ADF2F3